MYRAFIRDKNGFVKHMNCDSLEESIKQLSFELDNSILGFIVEAYVYKRRDINNPESGIMVASMRTIK